MQVQCQLFCTKRSYCDFIVWLKDSISIERIYPDDEFIHSCIEKAASFFQVAILPEIMGKFYSRPPHPLNSTAPSLDSDCGPSGFSADGSCVDGIGLDTGDDNSRSDKQYCYCRGPESGRMIACDNPSCPMQWFHFQCLQLNTSP